MLETHFPIKKPALAARLTVVKFMFFGQKLRTFWSNGIADWPFWYRKYEIRRLYSYPLTLSYMASETLR